MAKIWNSQYPERPVVAGYMTHFIAVRTDGVCLYMLPSSAEICYYNDGSFKVGTQTPSEKGWKSYWYQNGEWVFRSESSVYLGVTTTNLGGDIQAGVNILEPSKTIIDSTNNNAAWMEAFEFWKDTEPEPLPPEPEEPPTGSNPPTGGGTVNVEVPDIVFPSIPYFSFNGVDCPDFLKVTSVGISALPSLEMNLQTIAGKYGVLDRGTTIGAKVFTVEVMLVDRNKSIFQMASELGHFLKGDKWKLSELRFKEVEGKYLMAKVQNSVDINDLQVAGSGTIEFVVPHPVYIDDEETVVTSSATSFTVNNKGTHEVLPVFKLTMLKNATNVEITNQTTGKYFRMVCPLMTGNVLEFDMNKKSIKINGETDMTTFTIISDWLELVEGNNTISMNASAETEVRFRALYE